MLESQNLRTNLQTLKNHYEDLDSSLELAKMVSKLAVLEVAGWIEECVDYIARDFVSEEAFNGRAREILEIAIDSTYGLSYDTHVEPLLAVALGATELARVEEVLEVDAKLDKLKSELGTVHSMRNSLAHTHTKVTMKIDAPEVTIKRLERLIELFRNLYEIALEEDSID